MRHLLLALALSTLTCTAFAQSPTEDAPGNAPFVMGAVHKIASRQLTETRTINIYLPDGYKTNDTVYYPVIYLLDGSANEDFVHIAGLVQFFNMMQLMPPAIVVGIANIDRKRDFTFPTTIEKDKTAFPTTGGSEKFISFIEQELQPFIEKNYRTNSSKTIIGQSLGGLLATEVLYKKPALFNNYIIVSPSLWWDAQSLLKLKPEFAKAAQNTNIYLAVGKEGEVMERDAKELSKIVKSNKSFNTTFHYMPDEDHATILHHAVYDAFKEVLSKTN
ncbi:alpha/beta hydrolase [Polluticoccus soli]|uniref:alpha/beta hydrolase n=1 Tax=Polluticoccus soli TaxID=3034150 RepID=UPI0023E1C999|nr:alpha/beta hydrolase-fold protein [Flavipsychrobacter sp. JY13-12]